MTLGVGNMNQEKIGKFIKEIRTKEHLSQQKFAQKYGVTYQAVSKWENGKNIPDISILKQMCEDYGMNLDDFLETKIPKKKKTILWIILFGIVILILIFITISKDNHFEFKTLSSNCNNFKLFGSMAYNDIKSSIYISNITYCGEEEQKKYQLIECALYESDGKISKEIERCDSKMNMTLEEFLETVSFKVDHYDKTCKVYKENSLYLEIEAKDQHDKLTTYKIPLQLKDECN